MVTNLSSLSLCVSRLSFWTLVIQFFNLRVCTFCFGIIRQLRRGWQAPAFSWLTGLPMTSLGIITKASEKRMSLNSFLCCHLTFSPSIDHMSKCSFDAYKRFLHQSPQTEEHWLYAEFIYSIHCQELGFLAKVEKREAEMWMSATSEDSADKPDSLACPST